MIEAGEHRDEKRKPLKTEIAEVEARLERRWADTRLHAAAVGDSVRANLASPYTLIGAAGLGFGIAWYYQQREPKPKVREPQFEQPRAGPDEGASMLTTLLNGLNLAGMVISLFPTHAGSGSGDAESDPR